MAINFIPLTRPTVGKAASLMPRIEEIFQSGMMTEGKYVKLFEKKCAQFLEAPNVVAMSNGTTALLLTLKCLNLRGEVILPSFTYSSDAHALLWCGLTPVFVDIDRETFNLDPDKIEEKITKKTVAILPTHVFGNPCEIDAIERIARKYNLKLIFDAAHAFGSRYKNKSLAARGHATIYSLTPTKVLTAGEGGLVVTTDKNLADQLRAAKLNGDNFKREKEFLGFTARMSELQAIVGLENLRIFKKTVKRRVRLVNEYKNILSKIEGIRFQRITDDCSSVYKDMTVLIDAKKTDFLRDHLLLEFKKKHIQSKVYFDPPLHKKRVYAAYQNLALPHTDYIAAHILSLPLYSHMPLKELKKVCEVIRHLSSNNKA